MYLAVAAPSRDELRPPLACGSPLESRRQRQGNGRAPSWRPCLLGTYRVPRQALGQIQHASRIIEPNLTPPRIKTWALQPRAKTPRLFDFQRMAGLTVQQFRRPSVHRAPQTGKRHQNCSTACLRGVTAEQFWCLFPRKPGGHRQSGNSSPTSDPRWLRSRTILVSLPCRAPRR